MNDSFLDVLVQTIQAMVGLDTFPVPVKFADMPEGMYGAFSSQDGENGVIYLNGSVDLSSQANCYKLQSVLLHELGHAVHGHTGDGPRGYTSEESVDRELEADEFCYKHLPDDHPEMRSVKARLVIWRRRIRKRG